VDRALASVIAHRWHPVAAPVSDRTVERLLDRLGLRAGSRVLDLGCGTGEWVQRAVALAPGARGIGVDASAPALEAARAGAARRGLADRVAFEQADAACWPGPAEPDPARAGAPRPRSVGAFDAVLCVGVGHVFGGPAGTLAAARRHLAPGGRVLLGEGFWEHPPDQATLDALGAAPNELPDLPGLVEAAAEGGFEPGWGHVSTAEEWDDHEWSWTGALAERALTHAARAEGADGDAAEALEPARSHRRAWLGGYRGRLGFLTVVLRDEGGPGPTPPATAGAG
jgi:SAM-dependent methyltransferase